MRVMRQQGVKCTQRQHSTHTWVDAHSLMPCPLPCSNEVGKVGYADTGHSARVPRRQCPTSTTKQRYIAGHEGALHVVHSTRQPRCAKLPTQTQPALVHILIQLCAFRHPPTAIFVCPRHPESRPSPPSTQTRCDAGWYNTHSHTAPLVAHQRTPPDTSPPQTHTPVNTLAV
jgi:hypothetical protein